MPRLLCTTAAALVLAATGAAAEFTLTILHTNDFHDRWEPINAFDSTCTPEQAEAGECFAGIARLATAVAEARERAGENVILLDAGDVFQGSLFFTEYGGAVAAEFMPLLGYDAFTVGNHEFNLGPEGLHDFAHDVDFPILAANLDASAEPLLADHIRPSAVLEVGGERIGIVGAVTEDTPEISSPGPNLVFNPALESVQAEIDRLEGEGIDKIIVLAHLGLPAEIALAEGLRGADVIVGGHSHTLLSNTAEDAEGPYPTMVNGVPLVQVYAYGKYLGELRVTWDDAGNVVSAEGEPILLDASVAEDEAVAARLAELAAPLEELRNRVVAEAAAPIGGDRTACRARECEMGNLVAEAMLDRVRGQGIQIAIQNGGGLRASIDAGPVTMGEVLAVLPFQNTLSTFFVTGATILAALENGVSQVEEGSGRFPQVAGLTFAFDPGKPAGSRVSDVMVLTGAGPVPLDPAKEYGVVSNNFVRQGGDGYRMFTGAARAYDYGPDLADVVAEYLAKVGPYTPALDGRIVRR